MPPIVHIAFNKSCDIKELLYAASLTHLSPNHKVLIGALGVSKEAKWTVSGHLFCEVNEDHLQIDPL